jgi:hypothetical protein
MYIRKKKVFNDFLFYVIFNSWTYYELIYNSDSLL